MRYVYEVEFVQKDGPPLTLKSITIHMDGKDHAEAEAQAWVVLRFWVKEECVQFLRLRLCQAHHEVGGHIS